MHINLGNGFHHHNDHDHLHHSNTRISCEKLAYNSDKPKLTATIESLKILFHGKPLIFGAQAIKLQRLEAPQSVQEGSSFGLKCVPDTKRDKMQSLSWYKNGREFYRYQPYDRSQTYLIFNLTGVNLDKSRSRNHTVFLTNTTSETEGRYKCEVTGLSFQEDHLETYIKVVSAKSGAKREHSISKQQLLIILITILFSYFSSNWIAGGK